ncbi:MAG: competence damage-inducible protein A, partial [Desulfurococcaceae archaeon]
MPRASVLAIGNEVVQGRVLNTNAQYLGRRLTLLGYDVVLSASVPDRMELIVEILRIATDRFSSDLIVTTGGLGPTYDDITSEALSKYLGEEHVVNEEALEMVRQKYVARGLGLTPERIKMAMMPKSAKPIPNPIGTAPGILVKKGNKLFVSLPGVPSEMQAIWEQSIEP